MFLLNTFFLSLQLIKSSYITSWTTLPFSQTSFHGGWVGTIANWIFIVNDSGYLKLNKNSYPSFDGTFNYQAHEWTTSGLTDSAHTLSNGATQVGNVIYFMSQKLLFGLFDLTTESYTYPISQWNNNSPYSYSNFDPDNENTVPCITYFNNHLLLVGGRGA